MNKPDPTMIYIVIGTKENVWQDKIGGDFTEHPITEIVAAFYDEEDAYKEIKRRKLKKQVHQSYGDSYWYKGGYSEMNIEICGVS
jgi:hypothetical protein